MSRWQKSGKRDSKKRKTGGRTYKGSICTNISRPLFILRMTDRISRSKRHNYRMLKQVCQITREQQRECRHQRTGVFPRKCHISGQPRSLDAMRTHHLGRHPDYATIQAQLPVKSSLSTQWFGEEVGCPPPVWQHQGKSPAHLIKRQSGADPGTLGPMIKS